MDSKDNSKNVLNKQVCGCSIKKALHVAEIGFWEWDIISDTLFWSEDLYDIYGIDPKCHQASQNTFFSLINQDDKKRVIQHIQECFTNKKPYHRLEYRIDKPNGFQSYIRETAEVYFNSEGTPIKITGLVQNITKDLYFENLYKEYNAIFRQIFENRDLKVILEKIICNYEQNFPGIVCSILLIDEEEKHLRLGAAPSLNPDYSQALNGIDIGPKVGSCGSAAFNREMVIVEDIANDPYWDNFRELALRYGLRACWSVPIYSSKEKVLGTFAIYYTKPAKPTPKELYIIEAAGMLAGLAIEHHQTLARHRQNQERLEQIIYRRTSEIEKQYRYLKKAKADIEAGLRAKSEFLANVSHELRTPLNAIMGFSDLLDEECYGPLNDKQKEFIGHIQKSSRNLLELINNVLEISRIESDNHQIKLEKIKLYQLINFSCTFVKEKAVKHRIQLCLDIPPELYDKEYISDLAILKTVLTNLMVNSAKFTPDGGKVTICVREEQKQLVFKITDNGVGIEKEFQEKIFEAFYQIKCGYQDKSYGAGLGLTVSRKMIDMLGGKIWVESEGHMKGSSFYFTVPMR